MLNKISAFLRSQGLVKPGDGVVCAVSGGADSVALLFAMYLLRDKRKVTVQAAHFNHKLRGEESDRDEAFVRQLCERYEIPLCVGSARILPGKRGLEAAAREARYAFLRALPGKIATAHTADDNAETVLMHLVRGTGLKGLGAISPVSGNVIRPMLTVTREEVLSFLGAYCLSWVEDSSNGTDQFLRNRLRHNVLPLLKQENPRLAENLSSMALQLREEEAYLRSQLPEALPDVQTLRDMAPPLRYRALSRFLAAHGLTEAGREHLSLLESVVFSSNPSASVCLPGGLTVGRCYDRLTVVDPLPELTQQPLPVSGFVDILSLGLRVHCREATAVTLQKDRFCVQVRGQLLLRSRRAGDELVLPGGRKSLKKLFIDKKIPASLRSQIPVLADEEGIVGVYGFGADQRRIANSLPCVEIHFEELSEGLSTI